MLNPDELYHLADGLPGLGRPVLIQALTGFVDAGGASRLVREHLLASGEGRVIATFDADQLIDYRARRPMMAFVEDHWEHYEQPALRLHLQHDAGGTPYLLLHGPEPDLQWDRFIEAVISLVGRLEVRLTIGLNGIPMAVPHTRPVGITAHATRRELIAGHRPWLNRVQVPAAVGNLLEYRLGKTGRDAIGFAAHVPHYLAQADYPPASEALLGAISRSTGLLLPADELRAAAELIRVDIDRQVAESEEARSLVRAMEEQYDAFVRGREGGNLLDAQAGKLPTAEELGAELERFLAEHAKPGDPPPAS